MKECPLDTCFVPDTTCALGHLSLKDCPKWTGLEKSDPAQTESGDEIVIPWSGSALGRTDIGFVAGRRAPTIVGVVGPENAGKTSLLAAWYLLIGRGAAISKRHVVAGSFTLTGWEAVARSMQWSPGTLPEFPAHTSTRGGRGQGLLHLAFREDGDRLRDYLFTDAPGLWFQKWAIDEEAPDAKGARWIAENADAFVLTADCAALAGTDRGSARSALQLLARRLGANRGRQRSHRGCDLVDSDTCNAGGRGDFGQIRGPSGANILALYGVHCWVFLFTPPPVHLGTRAKYVDNLLLWNARPPQLWTPDYVKQRIPRKSCRRTKKQHRCDLRSLCWNFQFHWFAAVGIVILDLFDPSVKFSSSPKAMTACKWRTSTLGNTAPTPAQEFGRIQQAWAESESPWHRHSVPGCHSHCSGACSRPLERG
jgi:hypothetical protein